MESKDLFGILSDYSPKMLSNGQIRMKCPFDENHRDGSGKMSFFISPEINAYNCFSCREHGSLTKLLTKRFEVNYFDAISLVKLTEYKKEKVVFDLDIKWDVVPPEEFLKRGFTAETLKYFKLGYSDDGWIVIPFFIDGKLVGYQKRIDYPDRVVKNVKNFDKKEYLYNLNAKYDYVILVEGYSDVMRLYQFGYNATALLGTSFSDWQVEQIIKFKTVYLALDNDSPGRRLTELCYHKLKNHTNVMFIPYLTKDPGECKSRRNWNNYFQSSTDYFDYTLEMSINLDGYMDMKESVLKTLEDGI